MRKVLLAMIVAVFAFSPALAQDYNHMSPEDAKSRLEKKDSIKIVDIQVEDEYAKGHLPGAVKTCAYPVKSDEDRAKLDEFAASVAGTKDDLLIVCPRGKGGAERTFDYLVEKGIERDRLYILEGGQKEWPYEVEMGVP